MIARARTRADGAALLRALAIFSCSALAGAGVLYWQRPAPARPAAAIVKAFDAVQSPGFSLKYDDQEFERRLRAALTQQDELAWELYRAHPEHSATLRLLETRWRNQLNYFHDFRLVLDETQRVQDEHAGTALGLGAQIANADAAVRTDALSNGEVLARVERLAEHANAEPGGIAWVFQQFARTRIADPARQAELFERAATLARFDADAPADSYRDPLLRVLAHVGQPIELDFDDALGGARWRLRDQRGRWVLVHVSDLDRWDVRRSGVDEEVAELMSLRAKLRELDVALVTVNESSDRDGREPMRTRARANGVGWPVFFEYDDFQSTWKARLEINEAPVYLLVDPHGALAAVCARPAPLIGSIGERVRAR